MNMIDPADGLEYVFMGDDSGNFYRMEGSGVNGDGGANDIKVERLTGLITVPPEAEAFDIDGYISYRKGDGFTVTIRIEYAGDVYAGGVYYGGGSSGGTYSTAFDGRITRQKFPLVGESEAFQLRVTIESKKDFQIQEIGLRLQAAAS